METKIAILSGICLLLWITQIVMILVIMFKKDKKDDNQEQ